MWNVGWTGYETLLLVVDQYEPRERSVNLPDIDIALIAELIGLESFNDALAQMTAAAKRLTPGS